MDRSGAMRSAGIVALAGVLLGAWLGVAVAADHSETARIVSVLKTYERALNDGDVDGVLALYDDDGVFMPQHSLPQVGKAAVRRAYEGVFKAIDLDIVFDIVEVEVLSGTWAFARTNSAGTTLIKATGDKVSEGNQELFLLRKQAGGDWKFARYIFSTTNPRQ